MNLSLSLSLSHSHPAPISLVLNTKEENWAKIEEFTQFLITEHILAAILDAILNK